MTDGHGTRRTYQHDACRCSDCRAANARYIADVRRQHASGRPPLGSKMPAKEAWQKIRDLKRERFSAHLIAQLLGLKSRCPRLHPDVITVRNYLKVRRIHRLRLSDPSAEQEGQAL